MTVPNRRPVRLAVEEGIRGAVQSLTPVPVVYGYLRTGFDGQSPVIRVWSESAKRPESVGQQISSIFRLTIQTWVIVDENGTNAEQAESENLLDAIESVIAAWVMTNTQTEAWNGLQYDRDSFIQSVQVGPYTYLVEQIVLLLQVGE